MGGEALEEAIAAAQAYVEETGATFVHPYEDEVVVAGQGTIGLELAEQVPEAETVLVPIGGGGLAAGIALALGGAADARDRRARRARGVRDRRRDRGQEARRADRADPRRAARRTSSRSASEEIAEAIVLLLERTKLVVEGAGAVGVAALLEGKVGAAGRSRSCSRAGTSTRAR